MYDVTVANHLTVHLVQPQSDEAREWLQFHADGQWFGGGLAVEPRYTEGLLIGMREDGFKVPLEARS